MWCHNFIIHVIVTTVYKTSVKAQLKSNTLKLSQRTTKPNIRLVRPAKTQISLRFRAVWSESSLLVCAFYNLQATQKGMNKKPCHISILVQADLSLLVTQVLL